MQSSCQPCPERASAPALSLFFGPLLVTSLNSGMVPISEDKRRGCVHVRIHLLQYEIGWVEQTMWLCIIDRCLIRTLYDNLQICDLTDCISWTDKWTSYCQEENKCPSVRAMLLGPLAFLWRDWGRKWLVGDDSGKMLMAADWLFCCYSVWLQKCYPKIIFRLSSSSHITLFSIAM